jgi:HEAT repeat protein
VNFLQSILLWKIAMTEYEKIAQILETASMEDKIKTLESLSNSNDPKLVKLIILKLDDIEIEVRGEAFSSLVLNENNISEILIDSLKSESKNIRGYSALVLANRRNREGIPAIISLTKDESSMVRGCALGALGYLKAQQAREAIENCFADTNLEVKKSALKAAIDIGDKLPSDTIKKFRNENDPELDKLLILANEKS